MPEDQSRDNAPDAEINDVVHDDFELRGSKKWRLPEAFSRLSITLITIVLTATITWYVNFRLSHLKPIISITNVEFIYDLKGKNEIIEIPEELVESDGHGFFSAGIKHFMMLEDLQEFTQKDRPGLVEDRYAQFEKEIGVFQALLEGPNPRYEVLAQYTLDFLRSNGFNGVASFLVYLEEEGKLEPLKGEAVDINSIKSGNGTIMVANNLYLLPNMWTSKAKTSNQKHMGSKIEWFAERTVYNLRMKNYSKLRLFLAEGKQQLKLSKAYNLKTENGILDVIEQKAKLHKKILLSFQIINRSDFPLLLHSMGKIIFENIDTKALIVSKAMVFETSDKPSTVSANNLFNAIALNVKSSKELMIKSREIGSDSLKEIEKLFSKQKLRIRIDLMTKSELDSPDLYRSDWVMMNQ